jgi:prepilin-type processing-associated H-X9-DG protein/prepilin-type N-terminal cleavage/methylation domain-containing protein
MRSRRAFTLVELLVVIGIITVLIAVLLPTLGRVREHANRVKCAANLRSIGQALTMYTQQYGYYPGTWSWDEAADAAIWPVRLRGFMGGDKRSFYCPSQNERCRWTDGGPEPVVRAGPRFVGFGYQPDEPLIHSRANFSYGYNATGASGGGDGSTLTERHKGLGSYISVYRSADCELRAGRVRVASDMIAIADSSQDGQFDYMVKPNRSTGAGGEHTWPGRIHGGGANVLFCDGHVTWYRQQDLLVENSVVPPAVVCMWNNDHLALGDR